MESKLAAALKLQYEPVLLEWRNDRPDGALQFEKGKWGCVMFLFAAAAKGRCAVFDRQTFGCFGGGVGLGFGNQYEKFPGGEEGFCHFLAHGNNVWEQGREIGAAMAAGGGQNQFVDHFMHGERYRQTPELVRSFIDDLPLTEIPANYVVFRPLDELQPGEEDPQSVTFLVTPDQLAALVIMANYDCGSSDNVIIPHVAGCQAIGILAYRETKMAMARGIVGLTDISARLYLKSQLGGSFLTFTVPYRRYLEMEANVANSFLEGDTWLGLMADV